jgi:hypothetical protein
MSNLPGGLSREQLIFIGEIEDDFDDEAYAEWRREQYIKEFDVICNNLGIETDSDLIIDDTELFEIIMAAHELQWPDTFTVDEYLEAIGE